MNRYLSFFAAAVLVVAGLSIGPAGAAIDEECTNAQSATWTESKSPVRVRDNCIIHNLTITEGTEVVVNEDAVLTITGKMTATGDDGAPVVIHGAADSAGYWGGIKFAETQEGSVLRDVEISDADVGLDTNRRAWRVIESYFHNNVVGANVAGVPAGQTPTGDFGENYVSDNETGVRVTAGLKDFSYNTVTENEIGLDLRTVGGSYSDSNIFANEEDNATSCEFSVPAADEDLEIDARSNYWGATDESDIADEICDGTDSNHEASAVIDYAGFELAPIEGAAALDEPGPSPSPSPSTTVTAPPDPASHARTVSLSLRRHLKARGTVAVTDGFAGCMPATVSIMRRTRSGAFATVKQAPVDATTGAYATRLRDRRGTYQASVAQTGTETDVCMAASSATARHRHRR